MSNDTTPSPALYSQCLAHGQCCVNIKLMIHVWMDEKMREAGKLSTLIGTRNQMGATSVSRHKMVVKGVQRKGLLW